MPAHVTGRVDFSQQRLAAAMGGPTGMVVLWVDKVTGGIRNRAVLYCPVDTGRLRSSIVTTKAVMHGTVVHGSVGTDVEYAAAVNNGSREHVIYPKNGSHLKFPGRGGAPVYARKVTIPARAPQPFLTRAMVEELTVRRVIV